MIQEDGRTTIPSYKSKTKRKRKKLSMKHSFPTLNMSEREISLKKIMCFTPIRGQTPNPTPQNLLVWESLIEVARIMLQPNTPNSGVYGTLPQRFGLLPSSNDDPCYCCFCCCCCKIDT